VPAWSLGVIQGFNENAPILAGNPPPPIPPLPIPGGTIVLTEGRQLQLSDEGCTLELNNTAGQSFDAPTRAEGVPLAVGASINFTQGEDGIVTITADEGFTLTVPDGKVATTSGIGTTITLTITAENAGTLSGQLANG